MRPVSLRSVVDNIELLFYMAFFTLVARFAWVQLWPPQASQVVGFILGAATVTVAFLRATRTDLLLIIMLVAIVLLSFSNYPLRGILGSCLIGGALGALLSAILKRLRLLVQGRMLAQSPVSRTVLTQRAGLYTAGIFLCLLRVLGTKANHLIVVILLGAAAVVPLILSRRLERSED